MDPETATNSKLKEWLDNLQQESWQLELLISGFVIFLLIGLYEPLVGWRREIFKLGLSSSQFVGLLIPLMIVMGAWLALLVNLIIHVLLRGLWISTVGLRYVSEEIDYEMLGLQERFENFLRRRIGSFDRYIERLEMLCSVLFAFTFLVIFIIFSLGLYLGFAVLFSYLYNELLGLDDTVIATVLDIALFLTGLLYFFDFLTLGRLKRWKFAARWYYPFYRFMGVVTLARLYRPLYYNLIDNRYGRRLGYGLVPYVLLLLFIPSISYVSFAYFPDPNDETHLLHDHYDDIAGEDPVLGEPSIPSRYVKNGFLEVFVPYVPRLHDPAIEAKYAGLTPAKRTGIKLQGTVNIGTASNRNADVDSLLHAMGSLFRLYVDDSLRTSSWQFYIHPARASNGLLSILDLDDLTRGQHELRIEAYSYPDILLIRNDSLDWREIATIPFWLVK